MSVDAQLLKAAIDEAAAGDAELAALLTEKFAKNDAAAVAFTGGFTRTADYTRKTQALSSEKKDLETKLATYQTQLEAAETEKAKIMRDLANQRVTVAQANARLQAVKDTYQLGDDDIPPMGDLIDTRKTGKVTDSTPDIEERLVTLRKEITEEITKTLIPELSGMANLDIVWAEIADEHRELTGKRLGAKDRQAILDEARKNNKSLAAVWEEKYEIPTARKRVEREQIVKEERQKWDDEQRAKISQRALEGVRPEAPDETGLRVSQVLKHSFQERGVQAPVEDGKVRAMPSAEDRGKLSGAERAAQKYLERRGAGVPLGGKEPVVKSA